MGRFCQENPPLLKSEMATFNKDNELLGVIDIDPAEWAEVLFPGDRVGVMTLQRVLMARHLRGTQADKYVITMWIRNAKNPNELVGFGIAAETKEGESYAYVWDSLANFTGSERKIPNRFSKLFSQTLPL